MLETIISSIGVFVSTSIDYLLILTILFGQSHVKNKRFHIYLGQYIGTGILVLVSLLIAYAVNFLPKDWMIGLLGLIPIYLGIKFALLGEGDEDEKEDESKEVMEKLEASKSRKLFLTVALLTIASGGDNLGVYIPFFASLDWVNILVSLIIFAIGIIGLCELSSFISKIPFISETIEKYERIIVPLVFIPLGIFIMYNNNVFKVLYSLFV
ncbi:CadD family cadmium resistance transporter [Helcococcus massiliensis]|uniref:CadD family cadmium resistance transporter n=1 Tax=Helcococcus massiliensis TaxID=2040290 RepID=UPI000CDECE6E|nr:CadD family cadmium resistance transporter [Helcococcus massiliensis]